MLINKRGISILKKKVSRVLKLRKYFVYNDETMITNVHPEVTFPGGASGAGDLVSCDRSRLSVHRVGLRRKHGVASCWWLRAGGAAQAGYTFN